MVFGKKGKRKKKGIKFTYFYGKSHLHYALLIYILYANAFREVENGEYIV